MLEIPAVAYWSSCESPKNVPIYHQNVYMDLFSSVDGSIPRLIEIKGEEGVVYFPLLVKHLDKHIKEGITPYGYGGFFSQNKIFSPKEYVLSLKKFLISEGFISIFIRHSPFLENQTFVYGESELNRYTYSQSLEKEKSLEDFIGLSSQKLRWSISYAIKNDLFTEIKQGPDIDSKDVIDFYHIYRSLMNSKKTQDFYFFSEDFFFDHIQNLKKQCYLACVKNKKTNDLVAAAYYLTDEKWVHYHLSASKKEFLKFRSVELMMAESIVYFGNKGYRRMHLGGGHSLDESDGLSHFKKKFSNRKHEFHVSKWILDQKTYDFERERKILKCPDFFLISEARG